MYLAKSDRCWAGRITSSCRDSTGCLWLALCIIQPLERIHMRFIIGLTAALMALTAVSIQAEPVAGLYQVREELVSQESEVRDAGLQQAFITLVHRLTGQSTAAQSSELLQYQEDPQPLISHYAYDGNTLIVHFDAYTVQAALQAANLPIWGSNRPAVFTWWQAADMHDVRLISDGQISAQALHSAAQYYGIPVRLPLGDLTEQLLISTDALADSAAIRASAERYNADVVAIVQQQATGEERAAQWQLWIGNEHQQGQVTADSQTTLARHVFAQINQHLAERFAIKPGEGELFEVRVAEVNLERFVLLERLLAPFSPQLREMTQGYVQWQVRSNPQQVRSQLALAHLHEKPLPIEQPVIEQELSIELAEPGSELQTAQQPSHMDTETQILYFTW